MRKHAVYLSFLIPVFIVLLLLKSYKAEPFESFSLRFNDVNFALQNKEPTNEVVFVAIDEPSVNNFGRWPWSRDIVAHGLQRLQEVDVVLLDMIFSEPTDRLKDEALANAIAGLNNTVCGFFLRHKSTQTHNADALNILSDSGLDLLQSQIDEHKNPLFISAEFAELNSLNILESCTMSANFSTLPEDDHLLRSYPVAVYFNETLYPSLALQGLRLKFNADVTRENKQSITIGGTTIELNKRGFTRLNFYEKEQYEIVSFLDLFNEKVKPSYFKDKIVILGVTEVGAGDVVSTPKGAFYGPLLHYTFLSNVLQNHLIVEPEYFTEVLMAFMLFVPFIVLLFVKKILLRLFLNILIYVLVYIAVRYIFVAHMIYIDLFYPLLSILFAGVAVESLAFKTQEESEKFIKNAFSSYLSEDLLQKLIQNPSSLRLGGENRELSILFSDIRGFTSLSESISATELITLLNRYFTPMTNAVIQKQGMLDKYIGDAVMAFFNAPVDVKEHADAACECALVMLEQLEILNKELEKEAIAPIKIGVGINSARVVVGNMGSSTRFNYTAVGDGVNLASRVEGLTKLYGVSILITENTRAKLTKDYVYRKIEAVQVKGKEEAVVLYELMPKTEKSLALKKEYEAALTLYVVGNLKGAKNAFKELVEKYEDTTSQYFLQKIEEGLLWGVNKRSTK